MIKLLLKGFIIGIGKIIPGVSGALLAISLGVYEKAIKSIANFFDEPIKNFKFLFPLGIGVLLAIAFTSKVIIYLLNNFYIYVMMLFIGLISGGTISIIKKINIKNLKISNYISILLSFIFVILLSFIGDELFNYDVNNNILKFIIYLIIGIVDAITMIIPGISGTAVMMLLGIYDLLLNLLSSINNISNIINNLNIYVPYFLGIILTIITLTKLISYLFDKKSSIMYSLVIGFSLSSILVLFIQLLSDNINLISIVLFVIGFIISIKLEKLN